MNCSAFSRANCRWSSWRTTWPSFVRTPAKAVATAEWWRSTRATIRSASRWARRAMSAVLQELLLEQPVEGFDDGLQRLVGGPVGVLEFRFDQLAAELSPGLVAAQGVDVADHSQGEADADLGLFRVAGHGIVVSFAGSGVTTGWYHTGIAGRAEGSGTYVCGCYRAPRCGQHSGVLVKCYRVSFGNSWISLRKFWSPTGAVAVGRADSDGGGQPSECFAPNLGSGGVRSAVSWGAGRRRKRRGRT